jgi:hypothetical protein
MDAQVDIMQLLLLDGIYEKFQGDALEPSDMPGLQAPISAESPSVPAAIGSNANSP